MNTVKILLIEISLVVVTNVHHVSARRNYCENLLQNLKMFPGSGKKAGLLNFQHAYKNLSIDIIEAKIDSITTDSTNQSTKSLLKKLAIAYFWYLFYGIIWRNEEDIFVSYPKDWCPIIVQELITNNIIINNATNSVQDEICIGYIVPQLLQEEDIRIGKMGILKALYTHWTFDKIKALTEQNLRLADPNNEMPGLMTHFYVFGYFTHVNGFVDHSTHTSYATQFKSIYMFCKEKGRNIIANHSGP